MECPSIENELRQLADAGAHDAATRRLIEGYGPEVRRFLAAQLRSETDAWDVFSMFCEDVWRGFPAFAWRCTARTWAYTLARNAVHRFRALPQQRPERHLALSSGMLETMARARTSTAPYRRTEVKHQFRELREQLPEEDQLILILRVDRGLGWTELAQVLGADPNDGIDLERESARLRKRFQLIKERLKVLAVERGLLSANPSS